MKKIGKMNELSWVLGIVLCSLGVCLCTKASFGLSMIAAPPYILHLKLSQLLPWYTQGTSEYIWQGFLLLVMCIAIRKFRFKFLLSFVAGIISGILIDTWLMLFGGNMPYTDMTVRIIAFILGEGITCLAIAFYFRTDVPLQIYELVVVQIAEKFGFNKDKTKLWNDISMFVISLLLALCLNRSFAGIGIGTLIITVVNAKLIELWGKVLDKFFTFDARFPKFIDRIK